MEILDTLSRPPKARLMSSNKTPDVTRKAVMLAIGLFDTPMVVKGLLTNLSGAVYAFLDSTRSLTVLDPGSVTGP